MRLDVSVNSSESWIECDHAMNSAEVRGPATGYQNSSMIHAACPWRAAAKLCCTPNAS